MKKIAVWFLFLLLIGCKSGNNQVNVQLDVKTYSFINEIPFETSEFKKGESIHFFLSLENLDANDARLKFSSGQQYDIEVLDSEGKNIWLWSSNKVFSQANSELIIYNGETITIHDSGWNSSLADGEALPVGSYLVRAWLANGDGNLATHEIEIIEN